MERSGESEGRDGITGVMRAAAEAVRLSDLAGEAMEGLRRTVNACGVLLYRYGERGELEAVGGNLASVMGGYGVELSSGDPLQQPARRMAALLARESLPDVARA